MIRESDHASITGWESARSRSGWRNRSALLAIALLIPLVVSSFGVGAGAQVVTYVEHSSICPEGSVRPGMQMYISVYSPAAYPGPSVGPGPEPRIYYHTSKGTTYVQSTGLLKGRNTFDVNAFLLGDPQPNQPDSGKLKGYTDVDTSVIFVTSDLKVWVACDMYVSGNFGSATNVTGATVQMAFETSQTVTI